MPTREYPTDEGAEHQWSLEADDILDKITAVNPWTRTRHLGRSIEAIPSIVLEAVTFERGQYARRIRS